MRPIALNTNVSSALDLIDFYTEVNPRTKQPRYQHVYKPRMLEILKHISKLASARPDTKARALALYIELKD